LRKTVPDTFSGPGDMVVVTATDRANGYHTAAIFIRGGLEVGVGAMTGKMVGAEGPHQRQGVSGRGPNDAGT